MAEKNLEKTIQSLQKEVQHLKDLHEVQEVMSRYYYVLSAGLGEEKVKLFALKTPGVRAEVADWGVYEGPEGIRRLFLGLEHDQEFAPMDPKGLMFVHTLTTPSVQVAGDGKTAKGVWISPGHETFRFDGKLTPTWSWGYMAADFVKEDGVWKIWHYHVYGMFRCHYNKSWVEEVIKNPPMPEKMKAKLGPNRPSTYHHEYSMTTVREYVPAPPDPYETFDESKAY
jgi:hypothetical protein